jgi:hypothetical protein
MLRCRRLRIAIQNEQQLSYLCDDTLGIANASRWVLALVTSVPLGNATASRWALAAVPPLTWLQIQTKSGANALRLANLEPSHLYPNHAEQERRAAGLVNRGLFCLEQFACSQSRCSILLRSK